MLQRAWFSALVCLALGSCSAPAVTPSATNGTTTVEVETVEDDGSNSAIAEALKSRSLAAFSNACGAGLGEAKRILPQILTLGGKNEARSIDNTLVPFNHLSMELERSVALASLMRSVHPDQSIRDAAKKCEQEVEKFSSELSLNRQLYEAFVAIDLTNAPANAKRLVDRNLRDFRRAGVDKDEATRKRLKAIDEELVAQGQKFGENIVKDVRKITLPDPSFLKGLPEDYIKSKTGKPGGIVITTDYPDYVPYMAYAHSDKYKRELYIAQKSRGGMGNELVLRKILELRYEKARLLGYENWADYITEDKMIKSGKNAEEFIARIVKVAKARSEKDYKELLALKKKSKRAAKSVADWEKTYYENKVKTDSYAFDSQTVRPYFEYLSVEKGLLDITSEIYDVQYRKAEGVYVWHDDVRAFDVLRSGKKLGRIYLDMHPREGKYQHAAQFTLRSGVRNEQLPEGVLVCNFPNPRTIAGAALMEHDDVVTMFHEFGHLMHHVLGGQQKWIEQSGVATEWDFVEAPSQMFEEWAWDYGTLSRFAKHHQTGAVIPKELVDRMRRADKFALGIKTVQQMFYASISLRFHQIPPQKLEMMDTLKELQSKYTPFAYVEGTRFYSNFGHLNGYSAIYYTYMWSLVIAKDMLTPFKQHGLMNKEWTYRYRDRILAAGGTKDAADLVEDFLGRKYTFKAFEQYLSE